MNGGSRPCPGWRRRPRPWSRAARGPSPAAVTIVTSFSAASKPMPRRETSLTHDGVQPLALELVARRSASAPVAVLGGEADEHLAGAAAGGERGEHVRRALEAQAQFLACVVLLELAGVRGRRGGSRRPPPPSAARRRAAKRARAAVGAARRRSRRRRSSTPAAPRQRRRWPRSRSRRRRGAAAASASAKPIRPDERLPT